MRAPIRWLHVLVLSISLCWAGAAVAAKEPPKGWITLNFVNADIGSVIKAMSEMTGRTFVVDPRVKGTLSITSPRPVSPSVAYDIVLSALRMQGYAAIRVNGVVRIVPEADAKFYASSARGKTRGNRVGGEMTTRVFSLRHESATQLQTALRPLIGASGTFNADADSNTLIVTDYADNLDRLQQVIASLDIATADEPVLIPLKYVSAEEVAALVSRVFMPAPAQAGAAAFDLLQVAVDNRSNSLIVRGRDRNLISKVQNLAASLDVPTPAAGNVHVIYLKNAQAVEVAKTLRNILSTDTSALSQTAGGPSQTTGPQSPTAPAGKSSSSQELGPGMIQADSASNALIITAPEAIFANLKAVVEKLDVRRAQVLVEALIAEVSADKAAEFGIQWLGATSANKIANGTKIGGGFGNSSSSTNIGIVASAVATGGASGAVGIAKGFNLALFHSQSLGVLARALQTQTNANILSTPTLLTLDNEEAKITVGSNVPFQTGQFTLTGTTSGTASPFQTIERKDVGLILKVKPQISQGGTVRLQISEEVSKLQQATDPTLASTAKRSLDSTVLVDDGQIVVLGGLIDDQVQEGEDRVPVLGDIPLLGNLFRYKTRDHTRTNLMIFLRPVIVRNADDAAAVTNPRYDYILGEQKALAPLHHPILPDAPAPLLSDELKWGTISPQQDKAPTATPITP